MNTKSLLSVVLGLDTSSWYITDVDLNTTEEIVYVTLNYRKPLHFKCKDCGCTQYEHIHDHKQRTWRHKDLCEYLTVLKADVPRVSCKSCHRISQVSIPWAKAFMRTTLSFQQQILDACVVMSLSDVQKMYKVSWYTLSMILIRAIANARAVKDTSSVRFLGIDEIAIRKGHTYLTLFYDLEQGEVIWVGEDRRYETLLQFVEWFGEEHFRALTAICCDMWDPYLKAIKGLNCTDKVVFDKFHIKKHLNDAVDKVRRQEHRILQGYGDCSLKHSKYLWLKNPINLTACQKQAFKELKNSDLKVARAYGLKELFTHFWDYQTVGWATQFFNRWFWAATHSRLTPVKKVATMLKRYWYGIINYIKHPLTNARSEGINSKIRVYTKRAYGYKTVDMLKNIIYLTCGGLNIHPLKSR
jgi:transposase